jgi:uncharacterized protein (DUF2141 family)
MGEKPLMQDEGDRRTQAPSIIEGDASNMRTKSQVVRLFSVVILLPVLLLPVLPAQSPSTGTLAVRVVGARNASGEIRVALFQNAEGFPGDASKALRTQPAQIDPQTLSAKVSFTGIPQGVYAVSVFHDENGNGKLDKNLVGIPKEAYGASNNPPKKMRPPTFDEAKFSLSSQQSLEIQLIH